MKYSWMNSESARQSRQQNVLVVLYQLIAVKIPNIIYYQHASLESLKAKESLHHNPELRLG